ncbi:hypothetical protein GF357_03735 [Candidatus Dojkabacteria bacterium]|nr:hypothetical protein [Candidatus Dojkabacteria bacterium]
MYNIVLNIIIDFMTKGCGSYHGGYSERNTGFYADGTPVTPKCVRQPVVNRSRREEVYLRYQEELGIANRGFDAIRSLLGDKEERKTHLLPPFTAEEICILQSRVDSFVQGDSYTQMIRGKGLVVNNMEPLRNRELDICGDSALLLQQFLSQNYDSVRGFGMNSWSTFHFVNFVTKDGRLLPALVDSVAQDPTPKNATLSLDTIMSPESPLLEDLVVIDATLGQSAWEECAEPCILRYMYIAPHCFTDTGVFVGGFLDYIAVQDAISFETEGTPAEVEFELIFN